VTNNELVQVVRVLGPQVVRRSIFGFWVWKKIGWEGRIHLVCPIGFPTEINHC
jgi:hypothetical protein